MTILLTTLNARYAHTSLGLRYLLANMGDLQTNTEIVEFIIGGNVTAMAEKLLEKTPRIIGLAVYIWNVEETTKLVALLKRLAPGIVIVLGGPEVSHETERQAIVQLADYVVTGWGEITLPALCRKILSDCKPAQKIHAGLQAPLDEIVMPYRFYTDEDIAHRTIYVEASRGCPFKCEFCLSSLDKTAWKFDLDRFLHEMELLHARGARQFKFVDRTFNLNTQASRRILQFFLDKLAAQPDDPVFAHFEVVPDHLPATLKESLAQFPPGTLQLEIGVQTFNPDVQALISRKQDNERSADNIRWLMEYTHAHLHTDLIAGLPGEDIDSFGHGFDRLVAIGPHEIQFGILKRLRGTPIIRHTETYRLLFDPNPPYTILATSLIDFPTMQRLIRFARYWDMIANSGRFANTLRLILTEAPFARFLALSDWLYAKTGATHQIALARLARLVTEWLVELGEDARHVGATLENDYAGGAEKPHLQRKMAAAAITLQRQARHATAKRAND
ncbi:MAG: radical SAM protein [Burkholderiaceae bacterium]|nr:radical SAM protein [Burkholderiaceae bacterium]